MPRAAAISLSVLSIFVGLWASTQWTAYRFGYQDALGGVVFRGEDQTVYWPWQIGAWWLNWGQSYPEIFGQAALFLIGGVAVGMVITAAARFTRKKEVRAFGAETWGTVKDARAAGLIGGGGTVIGRLGNELLTFNGPEHQAVFGGTRSGKGVGHVIPTLLAWPASAVVYDIKAENWAVTAGYRSSFSHAFYFRPNELGSAAWNPFNEIRKGPHEIGNIQNIVEILTDPASAKKQKDIWDRTATEFLVALILHILYTAPDEKQNLAWMRRKLARITQTCKEMKAARHRLNPVTDEPECHPEVLDAAENMLEMSERFRTSVQGTAKSYFGLYADEIVAANTSRSDFCIADLVCGKHPTTLYIIPPPADSDRLAPLVRLLINLVGKSLMEHRDRDNRDRPKRHRLLFLIDEFPSLGKLNFFERFMREMAGYGLKAMLVAQSFNDIDSTYGRDNVIIDNCHVIVGFASNDTGTQQRLAQMVGQAVEVRETENLMGRRFGLFLQHKQVHQTEQRRPVLDEGQVRTLDPRKELVFVTGAKPFLADKVRYYENPDLELFKDRLRPPPDQASAIAERKLDVPGLVVNDWAGVKPAAPSAPIAPVPAAPDDDEQQELAQPELSGEVEEEEPDGEEKDELGL